MNITDRMRDIHTAFATPPEAIAQIVRRAVGGEMLGLRKIIAGYDSEVFAVDTSRGAVIVKLRAASDTGAAEEAWAMHRARMAGVPVADVLYVDARLIAGERREVMVQSHVPGQSLAQVAPRFTPAQRALVYNQIGAALAALHSIHVGGFYKLDTGGAWDFPDWAAISASTLADRTAERPLLAQAGFADADIALMLDMLDRLPTELACPQPRLLHGDVEPGHIYVDSDLRLTGLIDFAGFQGGHPLADIAILITEDPALDLAALRSGYDDEQIFGDGFERRLLLHRASFQIGFVAYHAANAMNTEQAASTAALRQTLSSWRAMG